MNFQTITKMVGSRIVAFVVLVAMVSEVVHTVKSALTIGYYFDTAYFLCGTPS